MLRRDISPNDHRDGSRKNSLNRFHYRVTRDTHSRVKSNISVTICGGMMVFNVCHLWEYKRRFDRRVLPSPDSGGIRIRKYYNGYGKVHVTRCRCKQWRLSVRVLKNDICLQKKSPSSFYSSKVIKVFCIGDKSWHTVVLRFVQPFQMKAEMLFGLCRLTSMLIFNRIQVKMLFLVCLVTRWLSFFL